MRIAFTVWFCPIAQPRHKAHVLEDKAGNVVRGPTGRPIVVPFIDSKHPVYEFKHECDRAATAAMVGRSVIDDGPVVLEAIFYLPRPSWCDDTVGRAPKKIPKYGTGPIRCWKKPDLDNLEKSTKDALKGIVWRDDSQVVAYGPRHGKWYHEAGGRPRCEIAIWTTGLVEEEFDG